MSDASGKPRRGIYLLPNLFTTSALFAGFFAVIAALEGNFDKAAIATLAAMVFDGLDGRIARMTNTQSAFGAEYDSLADVVSFGVGPALVAYLWSLKYAPGHGLGQLGWIVAFVFTACAALRLARFNVQIGTADKRFFQGLASPSAAGLVVTYVWVAHDLGVSGQAMIGVSVVVTAVAGLLMVSNFAYYSFKDIGDHKQLPFVAALFLVLVYAAASLDPPKVLFGCFAVYALSGPAISAWTRFRRHRRQRNQVD
ncbi:MAG: CDP-diacylglycerol--serine O-phosphatidyltransferase [Pseudomonadota bacterium]